MFQNFGTNMYSTDLTNLNNGMLIKYYILGIDSESTVQSYPTNAPESYITFILGDLPDFYINDFESEIQDWVIGDELDNATSGIWERAIPIATFNDADIQVQPGVNDLNEGQYCFITGNGFEQGNGGFDDIDNGKTSLFSPTFDLSSYDQIVLSYWRWYTNNIGDNGDNDKWQVSVSSDNGVSWVILEETSSSLTSFSKQTFLLSDFISLTSDIIFRFTAEDIFYDGDNGSGGSLVEAAIDDFKLEYISENILGDLNNDLLINIQDIIITINLVLENQYNSLADMNLDGFINVLDVVQIVNIILE